MAGKAIKSDQRSASAQRLERLVELCKALPESEVDVAGEQHLAFRIRKRIFAYYLFDHHGDGKIAFCCKSSLSDQRRFVKEDPVSFFVPPYLGPKGWIALRLDLDEVDWETVSDLVRRAYQDLAPRKLAALVE
ncbi:MAG TPA: MmcQ/YjbR family DNA-binding protein [Pyrinomonadaceae bacterium]